MLQLSRRNGSTGRAGAEPCWPRFNEALFANWQRTLHILFRFIQRPIRHCKDNQHCMNVNCDPPRALSIQPKLSKIRLVTSRPHEGRRLFSKVYPSWAEIGTSVLLETWPKFRIPGHFFAYHWLKKSAYCVIPSSLKHSDKCKWCGRVFWSCSGKDKKFR